MKRPRFIDDDTIYQNNGIDQSVDQSDDDQIDGIDQNDVDQYDDLDSLPDEMLASILSYLAPKDLYRLCGAGPKPYQRCHTFKSAITPRQLELVFNVYSSEARGSDDIYESITVNITYNPLDLLQLVGVIHTIRSDVNELFNGDGDHAQMITLENYAAEFSDMENFIEELLSKIKKYNDWPSVIFVNVDAPYDNTQMVARYSNVNWDINVQGDAKGTRLSLNLAKQQIWNAGNLVSIPFASPEIANQFELLAAEFMNQMVHN